MKILVPSASSWKNLPILTVQQKINHISSEAVFGGCGGPDAIFSGTPPPAHLKGLPYKNTLRYPFWWRTPYLVALFLRGSTRRKSAIFHKYAFLAFFQLFKDFFGQKTPFGLFSNFCLRRRNFTKTGFFYCFG